MNMPRPRIFASYAPGLRLFCGILAGTAAGYYSGLPSSVHPYILPAALTIVIISAARNKPSLAYWIAVIAIGFSFSARIPLPTLSSTEKILPEFPALFHGELLSVLKQDSLSVRLLAEGELDAKEFAPFRTKIILTVFRSDTAGHIPQPGSRISASLHARIPRSKILPSDFDEAQYCAAQNVRFLAVSTMNDLSVTAGPEGIPYLRYRLQSAIGERLSSLYTERNAGLALALLTGDKTRIDRELWEKYSLSGTAHVLAVSGLHVGIIASVIVILLGFVRNAWIQFAVFVLALAAFIFITGFQASAMRAGLMALLFAYARLVQRHAEPLNIILVAGIFLLLLFPEYSVSPGFFMSAGAVLGISFFYRRIRDFLSGYMRIPAPAAGPLALTLSSSLVISPIVAWIWGVFSVVSPLANFFVVPLMSLAMLFTMLSVILPPHYSISQAYAASAEFLYGLAERINGYALSLPHAAIKGSGLLPWALFFSLALLCIVCSSSRRQAAFRTMVACLCCYLAMNFQGADEKNGRLLARENFVAAVIPLNGDDRLILLSDRKKKLPVQADRAFIEYVAGMKGKVLMSGKGYVSSKNIRLIEFRRTITRLPADQALFEHTLHNFGIDNFPQAIAGRDL